MYKCHKCCRLSLTFTEPRMFLVEIVRNSLDFRSHCYSYAQQATVWAPSSVIGVCENPRVCVAACQAHAAIHFWWYSVSQLTILTGCCVWCDKLHWPPFSIHQHQHDKFTTPHVDPLHPSNAFRYPGPKPQRIMTSHEIIRPGLTDRPCDFLPPKSTRQWPRHPPLDLGASAPFFWDCRTSGSWCCGRVRLKYLIFPFFVLPLPSPHIILWFQCPAAVSDRKAHGALWKMYLQKLTLYGNFTTGTRLDLAIK